MILHLRSVANLIWILTNSAIINAFQIALYLFVRPFDRAVYRRWMGSVQSLWIDATRSSFPFTTLAVTGHLPIDINRPAIIISNHQVDADWWYIWQAASYYHGAGNIKIVLKDQLKYLPVVGWGMRLFDFLFLRRNLEQDAKHITEYMNSLNKDQFPFWLVFFPEGTTVHTEYIIKANAFAKRTNRPTFQHVVLPRTAGLRLILDAVKDIKPDIYDLTIAYPTYSGEVPTFDMEYDRKIDTGIPSMKTLIANKSLVQPVAIHGQKFTFDEANKDLEKFLDTRWAEKEVRLEHYIKHQSFPVDKTDPDRKILHISRSITVVFRLWFGVTIAFFLLPFVMFSFFPLYTTWVIYCFLYSIYDRTTRFWWPYIMNLILDSANKTKDKISFRK